MNYTLDASINFYEELMKSDDSEEEDNDVNTCLITNKPLVDNYITLKCNHKFNYDAIFHEVVNQKTRYNPNEITKLRMNEIKCPYCRQKTANILPYVPCIASSRKIIGVTIPTKYTLPHMECCWKFKSGKNKGSTCGNAGFASEHGKLCEKHWNSKNKTTKLESIEWTDKMQKLYDSANMVELREQLRARNMKISGNKKELVIRIILKN
jgi:hypothetical protein|tara:strand:- start:4792 stop:5418 length:627 start_codon:yes stop_codon:yes gene_type:complete